jgi:small-conductance mechanosensitive channel
MDTQSIINSIAIIISAYFGGVITKSIVFRGIERAAQKTKWEADKIIITSAKDLVVVWFVIAGVYFAGVRTVSPDSLIFLKQSTLALFIITFTYYASNVSVKLVNSYMNKNEGAFPSTTIFVNLTKVLIIVIGALTLLQSMGISITPIITALGVGGLAIALALQDTLSNLFSGIHILASKQIRPGDFIKLDNGEDEGFVEDISWRNTSIKTLKNNTVIIPNSKLANISLTNYNYPRKEMSMLVPVGVSYSSDLEKVEKITIEVAKEILSEIEGGVAEFEPLVRYNAFSDYSISFNVVLRAKEFTNQFLLRHEFIKRLHKRYKKEGIEIPYPIRTVHLKK